MLSAKLIQLIEDHWQGITTGIIHQVRSDPHLDHFGRLPDAELQEIGRAIFRNLGTWLTASEAEQRTVEQYYEAVGRTRFAEHIPLQECVRGLQVVRKYVVKFTRDRAFSQNSTEIYGEEELEHRLNEFFDDLVYHEVLGYEDAIRKSLVRAA